MAKRDRTVSSSRVRIVLGVVAALTLALLIAQPAVLMGWVSSGDKEPVRLRLAAYEGDVGALEWIALEQGFFERVGLSAEVKGYASGKEAMDALRAGQADVATASEYVFVTGSFDDPALRTIASISHYRNKGVVGRRDRGIERPTDLKGKKIGLTSPSGAEYTLYVFLALNGLTDKDVAIVNLSPQGIVDGLKTGSIDAAITWQPHVQALQASLGGNGVTFEGSVFDVYLLLATRQDLLVGNKTGIKKLLHALTLAEDWMRDNPAAARALVARRFRLDPAAVEDQWPRMRLGLTLPQELLVAMDGEARWLAARGKGQAVIPNFAGFIAAEPLREVNPSAVTLFTDPGASIGGSSPLAAGTAR